jgi:GT2 family glycosyltransferase
MDNLNVSKIVPKVSVIIPAYNQASYVSKAIQSVLDQTYSNFEIIVVNDGSTDETPQILARILDPRVRIISQPNAGLSAARNTGIRESSAPLVTLLDADDLFMPDKLAILVAYLENHPEIGMVSGGTQIIDQNDFPLSQNIQTPGSLELPGLFFANPFIPSAIMVRRSWLERVGVFDESLRACEDWDMWHRLAKAGCRFAWVENLVAAYRYHPGQMTRESERMRKAIFTVLDKSFNDPDLPENLRRIKDQAFAMAWVHAAAYAYFASEYEKGQYDLAEAVRVDPRLKADDYQILVEHLVGWSNDPRTNEPTDFLERIISNSPKGFPGLDRKLRRAIADQLLGKLFSSSRENWRKHKSDLMKIILYKPDWLLNRGVLRMVADAWLHF